MLYEITCAFLNKKGQIELHSQTFACKDAMEASLDAKDYFTQAYSNASDYIYSAPLDVSEELNGYNISGIRVKGRNIQIGTNRRINSTSMMQINHATARGVQINGSSNGTVIITGDSVQGNLINGDKVVNNLVDITVNDFDMFDSL